jgi:hypothetical protein
VVPSGRILMSFEGWPFERALRTTLATNRRVLGSMSELAFQAGVLIERGNDLTTVSCQLADVLMSALGDERGAMDIRGRLRAGCSPAVWIEPRRRGAG